AWTLGNHIGFDAGQWAPSTSAGDHLIAHELQHVVQQARGPVDQELVQRYSWDDFTKDVEDTGEAAAGAVKELATSAASAVAQADEDVGAAASDVAKAVGPDPEEARANLLGAISATRQELQSADPDTTYGDSSQLAKLNQNISTINQLLPGASIPNASANPF